jgi:HPt (histidine-containing phosphotransfer) domain-containing protein
MTSPSPSFLDFFVLEAGEYVEQLDGILLRASTGAPDAEALQKTARALRGSATMAKLGMFAELASTLEALGRALKQGSLAFDPALKGALTGAIDDLKILVRAARTWTAREDQLVVKRIGELSQFAGIQPAYAASVAASSGAYFAAEAGSLATELEALVARPTDRPAALSVLQRVRALRGVAGVRDVPALAEASEAAESAVRPLELSDGPLPGDNVVVLRAAGELLRAVSRGLSTGKTVTTATPEYHAFLSALDAMLANESGADRVIPIADLFFDDPGPHIVTASPNPPTTPAQRFRMEVVSLGEHLHRVIDEARRATDDIQREHVKGGLGRALRAIRATAASFGQMAVAQTVEGYLERTGDLSLSALDAISSFAATISPAATAPTPLATSAIGLRMTAVHGAVAALGSHPTAPVARPPMRPTTATTVAAVNATLRAPSVHASLDTSIAAFESLALERMAEPALLGDDVVPVDALFYRGRAALDRAIELRDGLRRAGGAPAIEVLEEIYDLLDLARVESPAF